MNKMFSQKLPLTFYTRKNVVTIAKELLGKVLVTNFNNNLTAGRIVETEAYEGFTDKASHAYNNRRTQRTEIMFRQGGVGYVYLCYGIHHLFNVVTNVENVPHAILIRAIEPVYGIETMLKRSRKTKLDFTLTKGPGNVSKALGISTDLTGESLLKKSIFIFNDGFRLAKSQILATTRIGVDYAEEDALLPYRFIVKGNLYVSGKKSVNNSNN